MSNCLSRAIPFPVLYASTAAPLKSRQVNREIRSESMFNKRGRGHCDEQARLTIKSIIPVKMVSILGLDILESSASARK